MSDEREKERREKERREKAAQYALSHEPIHNFQGYVDRLEGDGYSALVAAGWAAGHRSRDAELAAQDAEIERLNGILADEQKRFGYFETEKLQTVWKNLADRDAETERLRDENDGLKRMLMAVSEATIMTGKPGGDREVILRNVRELISEVEDWRESARKAAEESCGDEKHCACVGLLRHMVVQLQHGNAELDGEYHRFRDAVADYIEAEGAGGTFDAGGVMAARKLLKEILEGG